MQLSEIGADAIAEMSGRRRIHFLPSRSSAMIKTAFLLTLIVTTLASMPAQAQQRVFVSGLGVDTNPCTVPQPCRTFQHAHDISPANSEINALDPAGYSPLTITKGISIQAHGWGSITQPASCSTGAAITVSVTTGDPVTLNGLLLDGAGTGCFGIYITSGASVQILNSVVRHFQYGIYHIVANANGSNLLIQDTIASDNSQTGINIKTFTIGFKATLSRITANSNALGVDTAGNDTTIANSVISNNGGTGLNSGNFAVTWLAKTVISGNFTGVTVAGAGTVKSYGDNYINDNTLPVSGPSRLSRRSDVIGRDSPRSDHGRDSAFRSTSGSRAMLTAIRRASSFVSIFACRASVGLSREYRWASACPLASRTT
jgi:hypothetical protein